MKSRGLFSSFLLLMFVAACGQKGPLIIDEPMDPSVKQTDAQVDNNQPKDDSDEAKPE